MDELSFSQRETRNDPRILVHRCPQSKSGRRVSWWTTVGYPHDGDPYAHEMYTGC